MLSDLAGIYITDDHIDVIVGRDSSPSRQKAALSDLELEYNIVGGHADDDVNRFLFKGRTVEDTITLACKWIATKTQRLRSVGIGSYGPFESISREDRDAHPPRSFYGQLQSTSHGRLSSKPLVRLFRESLLKQTGLTPLITIDTDVAAAVIGEVFNRTWRSDGNRDRTFDNQVFVFVKVSLGVGAAFMRAKTPWQGRLHTEGGQIFVPRWKSGIEEIDLEEAAFQYDSARNPGSVEALASIPAINARFRPLTFDILRANPAHKDWQMIWNREAWYIAHLLWAMTCIVSPHRIVMGGRVMGVPGLLDRLRSAFADIAGDPPFPYYSELSDLNSYITGDSERDGPEVGKPGIVGALCIAAMEHQVS